MRHSLLLGPVHVSQGEEQGRHELEAPSLKVPSGQVRTQLGPDRVYGAVHEVHCSVPGPTQNRHPTAHAAHRRVATSP